MTPGIRFKGFTQDWEQRKLISLGNLNRGKSKHRPRNDPKLYGGEYPFIQTGDVAKAGLFLNSYKQTYSEFGIQQSKLWDKGTLLITIAANIAETSILGIQVAFPDSVIGFESNQVDMVFLKNVIDNASNTLKSKVETSSQANLNLAKLSELNVNVPSLSEQTKIGELFTILENAITLHQDKLEKLKQLKEGYLQLMFPQKEEKVPKLRLSDFSIEWEQRKLREVIESELKGKAKAEMRGDENAYLETNYLNGGNISYVNSPSDVDKDDVIILWDGSQAGTVYHGFKGALGSTLKAYKPKESGEFIYHFLKRNQQKIYNNYRTPNIPHVVKTFIDEFYVNIPIFDEQQRISTLFQQLDYTITLHQKKISTLMELKKAYLQKLFV